MRKNFSAKKLGLGTVQFGLDYGINNPKGKIPPKEVFKILDYAKRSGIDTLDTAYNYGESEELIGKYLAKENSLFKVISKLPVIDDNIEKKLKESLNNLHIKKLYGYLFHDYQSFIKNPKTLDKLNKFKDKGLIKKTGFSLYSTKELDFLLDKNIKFDILQVPFNIFDQRFIQYFPKLKEREIEIHVRSVFLQGLMFKKPKSLTRYFLPVKKHLENLNKIADELNISISSLCLNFVLNNIFIDKAIIGVDSLKNLKENLDNLKDKEKVRKVYNQLLSLKVDNEKIILPTNWK